MEILPLGWEFSGSSPFRQTVRMLNRSDSAITPSGWIRVNFASFAFRQLSKPRVLENFQAPGGLGHIDDLQIQLHEAIMLQQSPMYAYIPALNLDRARQFYELKIGLRPAHEVAGGVTYELGNGTACFLYPTPNAGTSKASQAFWVVEDVEKEVAELRSRGVKFEEYDMPGLKTQNGIAVGGGAKTAWFQDSEGNIMAIVENY